MKELTEADVRELPGLRRDGGWTIRRLAERFHVSVSTIYQAIRGRDGARVDGPKSEHCRT